MGHRVRELRMDTGNISSHFSSGSVKDTRHAIRLEVTHVHLEFQDYIPVLSLLPTSEIGPDRPDSHFVEVDLSGFPVS